MIFYEERRERKRKRISIYTRSRETRRSRTNLSVGLLSRVSRGGENGKLSHVERHVSKRKTWQDAKELSGRSVIQPRDGKTEAVELRPLPPPSTSTSLPSRARSKVATHQRRFLTCRGNESREPRVSLSKRRSFLIQLALPPPPVGRALGRVFGKAPCSIPCWLPRFPSSASLPEQAFSISMYSQDNQDRNQSCKHSELSATLLQLPLPVRLQEFSSGDDRRRLSSKFEKSMA